MIVEYNKDDINQINVLGRDLNLEYLFKELDNRKCYVFKDNNNLIGFITFDLLQDRAEIIDIIVHINYRKKGIGQNLLNEAIKYMQINGIKNVSLEVKVSNKEAINLYKKNDFKITTTRKNYYESGSVDAYLMCREM